MSGQQGTAEFNQGIRNYEAQIQNVISETSNGFYRTEFTCNAPAMGEPMTGGGSAPGANEGCVFAGKLLFPKASETKVLTLIGRQFAPGSTSVAAATLAETDPTVLPAAMDLTTQHSFGLQVRRIVRLDTGSEIGAFGFIVPTAGGVSAGNSPDSVSGVRLYGIVSSTIASSSRASISGAVSGLANLQPMPGGIKICLRGGNDDRAEITVGTGNSQTSIISFLKTQNTGECAGA